MFPPSLRSALINSFSGASSCRQCALCGTSVVNYLDEMPCPHWFITTGHRAFSERHLRKVFDVYGVPFVIEYLRLVCTFDRVKHRDVTATPSGWSIGWRDRRWIFEATTDRGASVQLSLFNAGRNVGSWEIAGRVG